MEAVYPPEEQADVPFYKYQNDEMAWNRYTNDEHNCFRYVDMRKIFEQSIQTRYRNQLQVIINGK